jgi:hypothetical protein
VTTNYTGYAIKFYTLATNNLAGGKDSNGCYRLTANAVPFESWIFANPDPKTLSKLRVTRLMGSRTTVYDYTYVSDSEDWTLQTSDGDTVLKQEKKATAWYPDRTGRETTRAITGADGLPVVQNIETIRTFSWGDGVTRRITAGIQGQT